MVVEAVDWIGWHIALVAASDLIDRIVLAMQGDPAPEPVCELRLLLSRMNHWADQVRACGGMR